jgi:sugar/nucleoside kinase (ribokinase family)
MTGTGPPPAAAARPRRAARADSNRPEIAVVGAHILDVLGRPVEAIPPGQGSARLAEIRATAAGTAAGTAVDLAKLGARVTSFGAIGADLLGDILVLALSTSGVDTAGIVRKPAAQTSATILPIRPDGSRPALHVPGASRLLRLADIELDRLCGCEALMLGGPDALTGLSSADLTAVVAAAKDSGALVMVDVLHPGDPRTFARIAGALALADWFCPNGDQLLALTDRTDLELAIADVLALGTGGVAVTLGADGCLVTDEGGAINPVPAIDVEVVDTTGCGDGFSAGFLMGLLAGGMPAEAARFGVACGALVATGLGSDAGIESSEQVLEFMRGAQVEVDARLGVRDGVRARERVHD